MESVHTLQVSTKKKTRNAYQALGQVASAKDVLLRLSGSLLGGAAREPANDVTDIVTSCYTRATHFVDNDYRVVS